MIRVLIADDHRLVRQGVRALLENANDITVVGEAENGGQALEMVEDVAPDIVVMDISMPDMNGIEATEMLIASGSETRVVFLSMYGDHDLVRRAFLAGGSGYLLKRSTVDELVEAVRLAAKGKRYLGNNLEMGFSDLPNEAMF
jgi:DNA-binding NarL/FixJ family response regulator